MASSDATTTATALEQQPQTPLTPLQLRQWQRAAQRSVRLALTAFKAGRTKVQVATEQGTAAATQLTNSLLTAQYVPSMPLPESLKGIGGLKAAAVSKLGRRQQQHLQDLSNAVQQVVAALAAMELALADVQAQLGQQQQQQQRQHQAQEAQEQVHTAGSVEQVTPPGSARTPSAQGAHSTPSAGTGTAVPAGAAEECSRMAVFHMLKLPEVADLLHRVLRMHQQDVQLKQQLLDEFSDAVASAQGVSSGQGGRSSSQGSSKQPAAGDVAESMRKRLTVLITCWMTKPHVDDDEANQLLQVITDEMTGF